MTKPTGALEQVLNGLLERSKEKGLVVFRGYIEPDEHVVIGWGGDTDEPWAFLDAAGQVGTRMLYVHAFRFEESDLREALEPLEPGENDAPELRELRQRLETFRTYVGHVTSWHVLFLFNGMFHAWSCSAPWYDEFIDLRDAEDEEELPEE